MNSSQPPALAEHEKQGLIKELENRRAIMRIDSDKLWEFDWFSDKAYEITLTALNSVPEAWHVYQWRESPSGWGWYLTKTFSPKPKIGDGWKSIPLYPSPPAPSRDMLRQLVDVIWNDATESTTVPSTTHADALIDKVFSIAAQPVSQRYKLPDGFIAVPRALTAENGAKAALIGEFNLEYNHVCHECFGEGCDDCSGEGRWINSIPVDWTTIKEIWAKAIEHFDSSSPEAP